MSPAEVASDLWPFSHDRPIKVSNSIQYAEINPTDYQLLVQRHRIQKSQFSTIIDFDENSQIVTLNPSQYANKYHPQPSKIFYFDGHFAVFERTPSNTSGKVWNHPENETPIDITTADLLITSTTAELLTNNFEPRNIEAAWLSSKLRDLNTLHAEYFAKPSEIENMSLNEIKNSIKLKLKQLWNIKNGGDALLTQSADAILPDSLYKNSQKITIPNNMEHPSNTAAFHSTALIALNCAALKFWNDKMNSKLGAYPKRETIMAELAKLNLMSNLVMHGATIIRPTSEQRRPSR